jgi:hypothetical protein
MYQSEGIKHSKVVPKGMQSQKKLYTIKRNFYKVLLISKQLQVIEDNNEGLRLCNV